MTNRSSNPNRKPTYTYPSEIVPVLREPWCRSRCCIPAVFLLGETMLRPPAPNSGGGWYFQVTMLDLRDQVWCHHAGSAYLPRMVRRSHLEHAWDMLEHVWDMLGPARDLLTLLEIRPVYHGRTSICCGSGLHKDEMCHLASRLVPWQLSASRR